MPDQTPKSLSLHRGLARHRRALLAGVMVFAASAALPTGVSAREVVAVAAPFEVGLSPSGNYLAALVAGADRDTAAAATFFRESLRADPHNSELIERTFVASLSNVA